MLCLPLLSVGLGGVSVAELIKYLLFRFMSVLISLIFSVLSTIQEYEDFANSILYWMVRGDEERVILNFTHNKIERGYCFLFNNFFLQNSTELLQLFNNPER